MKEVKYSKKRIGPIVEKYDIDTNSEFFINIIEMFSDSIDYQVWALKMFYGNCYGSEGISCLKSVKDFIDKKPHLIKHLGLGNILRYHENDLSTLLAEIKYCGRFFEIKKFIDLLNTDQRNLAYSDILCCQRGEWPSDLNRLFDEFTDFFAAIERISLFTEDKKMNIITLASAIREKDELISFISKSSRDSYEWKKESLLNFIAETNSDCEVVFNSGDIVVVEVKGYRTCDLLCGGGRTSWCITRNERFYDNYVTTRKGNKQYLVFNFGVEEFCDLAHVGFTVTSYGEISHAHTTSNVSVVGSATIDGKKTDINKILSDFGIKEDVYLKIGTPCYEWSMVGFLSYLEENGIKPKIAWENGSAICIETSTSEGLRDLVGFALVNYERLFNDHCSNKNYVLLNFNVDYSDTEAITIAKYSVDEWGASSMKDSYNGYNKRVLWRDTLKNIGITEKDIIGTFNIDSTKLLHKYIMDKNEDEAVSVINNSDESLDINFEHDFQKPIFRAIDNRELEVFKAIVGHKNFDTRCVDVFECPVLTALVEEFVEYDERFDSKQELDFIKEAITFAIRSGKFDVNQGDCNGDTPLHIAASSTEAQWIIEELINNGADVTLKNTDLSLTPAGMAERATCSENVKFFKKYEKGEKQVSVKEYEASASSCASKELIDILSKRAKNRKSAYSCGWND